VDRVYDHDDIRCLPTTPSAARRLRGMNGLFVGVDVGTTRVKAIAVDSQGSVYGGSERPMAWRGGGGRAEVDPMTLVQLAQTVAAEAANAAAPSLVDRDHRVLAIGVTGMAETGVLVDGKDQPLAPAIAWHDPRGDVDTIAKELGAETFRTVTGLPLTTMPSLAKLLWLHRNRPETKLGVRFYSVGEWVVRRLGGAPVAELSLVSRTGLFDVAAMRPWDAAFGLLGSPLLLGEPVVAGTPAGHATGDDMPAVLRGAVLTVAGHDHQVAAYGVGAATDGALFDSLGTAEALVRSVRAPLPEHRVEALTSQRMSVGWGVVDGHLCILAGLPTGLTLNRIATTLGANTSGERMALGEQAVATPGKHPTLRLVDLQDEQFGIAGITDGITPALLWRTAVDGLTAESERILTRIETVVGPYQRVVVAGGWLHNPALFAAKQRQYGAMGTTAIAEPGAYGAALLAAGAVGFSLPPAPAQANHGASYPTAER
jgi:sugar (pentulose or hexulose) kinase